jgi:septum site-determining protein MinD
MNGRLVALISQKGGVGTTTLAANLACLGAAELGQDVALVDLELPFAGDCTVILGGERGATLATLADELPQLTPDMLAERLARHRMGVRMLPATLDQGHAELVTAEVVAEAIDLLLQAYPLVVADVGAGTDAAAAEALDRASNALVVCAPELLAVNRGRQTLAFLQTALYPRERIQVLLNRAEPRQAVSNKVVELNLRQKIAYSIPRADDELQQAALNGAPLVEAQRRHAFSRAMTSMLKQLLAEPELPPGARIGVRRPAAPAGRIASAEPARSAQKKRRPQLSVEALGGLLLDDVVAIKRRVHARLVGEMNLRDMEYSSMGGGGKSRELRMRVERKVAQLLDEEATELADRGARLILSREILAEALGLGPLDELMADEDVSEVMVNGPNDIFVERGGKIQKSPHRFTGEEQLRTIIERIVVGVGRRIDENSPMVDARLEDGSRVNAVIPPLALDGSILTIRKFASNPLKIDDLVRFDSLTHQMAEFLRICVQARKNVLISGGTGSGKTTLLNILSGFIPTDERIVTIEDSAELQLPQEHVVRLETRPSNVEGSGEVSIRDLVRNSLRMRPDRIVVGECRGGEALDMLQAMNTGHDGSLTTVHANNPRDALARLETMSMMAGLELPSKAIRDQIVAAVDVIVQQSRLRDGSRRVIAVSELTGMEGTIFTMQDIFLFHQTGMDGKKVRGTYGPTGMIPSFLDDLVDQGFEVPREIFLHQAV